VPQERLTKDQRREAAREAARIARAKQKRRDTINSVLVRGGVTLGIVAVVAIVGLVIFNSVKPAGPGPLNMASDGIVLVGEELEAVPTTSIPADGEPTATDTSDLGVDLNIVMYVDYLCPVCGAFEEANAELIETLVTTGQASIEIHPVSILDRASSGTRYSSRAANAVACVAENEPDSFWDAHATLFANQPDEGTSGLSNSEIIGLFEGAGITSEAVASCINDESFKSWVTAASDRATSDPELVNPASGYFGTPTVFANGERYTGSVSDVSEFATFLAGLLPAETETETETETTE
tara:strand:- start:10603 stop:11490 length:888 start_codon:yes stop_codon:yes gene_type:complete